MRILHVVTSLDPEAGGVSQAIRTIIKGLDAVRIENEVVCLDEPSFGYLSEMTFLVHALGPGVTPWQYNKAMQAWLEAKLGDYEVVIVHGLWQYPGYACQKVFRNLQSDRPRLFVMPHGMLDPYFQKAPGRKMKALRHWFFWKIIERKLIHLADAILFTCETEKLLARQSFKPYSPKLEKVTGLGVERPPAYHDKMKLAFSEKCIKTPNRYFLYMSRIHEKKGTDLLIKAWLRLQEESPGIPDLVIAGPGLESEYGRQIKELASVSDKILFPGMLSGDAKWGAFYVCEAFVLPSHQENFGIAVVEALACRKPVLISNQVNIWREIDGEGAGIVSEDNAEGTFYGLKTWCAMSRDEKDSMAFNAESAYNKFFSVEKATDLLLEAIS